MNEIIKASDFGLTEKQGLEISNKFEILTEEKSVILSEYNEIIKKELTVELSAEASVLDRKMQKHLKAKKDIHTANKAFFLNGGRFVDSIYNVEKVEFDIMREKTGAIKNYAESLKKERLEKLQQERILLIKKYVEEIDYRNYSEMETDVWDAYFNAKKIAFEDKVKAEKEADKLARAPIKKQLKTWIDTFYLGKPVADNETTQLIEDKFESFKGWAKLEIENI